MRSLRKDKKGIDVAMLALGTLVIGIIVFTIFLSVGGKYSKSKDYLLEYHAEDLQLLLESVQAVPGDVSVPYTLSKGVELDLQDDRFSIVDTQTEVDKQRWLHLTSGMVIKPGTGAGSFNIIKKGNMISISAGSMLQEQQEACTKPHTSKEFDVTLMLGKSTAKNMDQDSLKLIMESLRRHLDSAGIGEKTTTQSMGLAISAAHAEKPTITVLHPRGDQQRENDYDYLYCALKQALGEEYEVDETIQGSASGLSAELRIGLPEDERVAFLKDRGDFASKVAGVISGYKEVDDAQG